MAGLSPIVILCVLHSSVPVDAALQAWYREHCRQWAWAAGGVSSKNAAGSATAGGSNAVLASVQLLSTNPLRLRAVLAASPIGVLVRDAPL